MSTDDVTWQRLQDLLGKYNGRITIHEIYAGIHIVGVNAEALLSDAALLLEHGRHGRAVALSMAALEELGKISVLWSMATITPRSQSRWRSHWQRFRDHRAKSTLGFVNTWGDSIRADPAKIFLAAMGQHLTSSLAEMLRQFGMYVDYNEMDKDWYSPGQLGDEEASRVHEAATAAYERHVALFQAGLYSEEVLQLRQEIYGPLHDEIDPENPDLSELPPKFAEAHGVFLARLMEMGIDIEIVAHDNLDDDTA